MLALGARTSSSASTSSTVIMSMLSSTVSAQTLAIVLPSPLRTANTPLPDTRRVLRPGESSSPRSVQGTPGMEMRSCACGERVFACGDLALGDALEPETTRAGGVRCWLDLGVVGSM